MLRSMQSVCLPTKHESKEWLLNRFISGFFECFFFGMRKNTADSNRLAAINVAKVHACKCRQVTKGLMATQKGALSAIEKQMPFAIVFLCRISLDGLSSKY